LPKYRGAAPIQWAIVNGETRTGVTTMQINAGLDTGDILLERETEIGPEETALELDERTLRIQVANARRDEQKRPARAPREIKATGPKLYCGDLPWELSSSELQAHFEQWGKVEDAYLAEVQYAAKVNGYKPHRGFGFVVYSSEAEATKALQAAPHTLKGAQIRVTSAKGEPSERKNKDRAPRNQDGDSSTNSDNSTADKEGAKEGRKEKGEKSVNNGEKRERKERKPKEDKGEKTDKTEGEKTAATPVAAAAPADKPAPRQQEAKRPEKSPKPSGVKIPVAPKVNPWSKKGDAAATPTPASAEDYPSLADVASGKVKAKPTGDAAAAKPAEAAPAVTEDKGKEEASK